MRLFIEFHKTYDTKKRYDDFETGSQSTHAQTIVFNSFSPTPVRSHKMIQVDHDDLFLPNWSEIIYSNYEPSDLALCSTLPMCSQFSQYWLLLMDVKLNNSLLHIYGLSVPLSVSNLFKYYDLCLLK